MNAPIGKADRRRARLHPARSSRPALIVHTFSEYTHHIRGGAKRLIIDADPDLWFDLGSVASEARDVVQGHVQRDGHQLGAVSVLR
ncbi:hypothetical protein, partial [Streptomyces sp. NPDC096934]|uniref:hypothetical protein n=1 Tax=Streptomyces sp. NPDC096934 TaxID=3155551 RepID=UPI00332DBB8F